MSDALRALTLPRDEGGLALTPDEARAYLLYDNAYNAQLDEAAALPQRHPRQAEYRARLARLAERMSEIAEAARLRAAARARAASVRNAHAA